MGENDKYKVRVAKSDSEAEKIMNKMFSMGWTLFDVTPIETRWTWDILLTFVRN